MRNKERIDIFLNLIDVRKVLDLYFKKNIVSEELKEQYSKTISEQYENIRKYWKKYPDLRFSQVLINMNIIPNYPGFWYYWEEIEILQKLEINPREFLFWGRNYDKNMNKLPKTEYLLIKDMETDHIKAILDGKWSTFGIYFETFQRELELRK